MGPKVAPEITPQVAHEVAHRILLVVEHVESLFVSGIAQQVYFTRQTLNTAGFETVVAATAPPIAAYALMGINTVQLDPQYRVEDFDVVLFVSTNLVATTPQNTALLERARKNGTRIVSMLCGNYPYLLQEQFVFKQHTSRGLGDGIDNPYIDEFWALETYRQQQPFMEALLGKPVRILPYCWNADIITAASRAQSLDPSPSGLPARGLRYVIAEPNVSIHKSALVPLLIANGVRNDSSLTKSKALVLSGQHVDHELLQQFLQIYRDEGVEAYPRLSLLKVLDQLRTKELGALFICHHIDNGLNFLHFELCALGHQVIHNSEQLANTGGYYQKDDVKGAVNVARQLLDESPAARKARVEREQRALSWFHPQHDRVVAGYTARLKALAFSPAR
jgi:hypothetical protein